MTTNKNRRAQARQEGPRGIMGLREWAQKRHEPHPIDMDPIPHDLVDARGMSLFAHPAACPSREIRAMAQHYGARRLPERSVPGVEMSRDFDRFVADSTCDRCGGPHGTRTCKVEGR